MRNVYLGTSDFAATVLRKLAESEHKPALVVTRPARPKGRGRSLQDPPVAIAAADLGLDLFQPESVNEPAAVARIEATESAALTVCAFGAIVKEPLLSMMPSFNVHPSLLPRWRGAAPVERSIAAGDTETGVTIMRLVEELDAGPMALQRALPITPQDTYGTLAPRLAELGGNLLVEALTAAAAGTSEWIDQDSALDARPVTYAEKIVREDRVLTPSSASAVELERMIRALTPHIGAMFELEGGDPLRVETARVVDQAVPAGQAVVDDGRLLVGTPDRALELVSVKPAGKQAMDAASYLRGNDVPVFAG
ncbi:MAG: methionyl-tRNA formyltransferase [Solirubrobacterales bacterium]